MNFESVIFAVAALFIIGIFHPVVIKCEYYFSSKIWPLFLLAGLACLAVSLFTKGLFSSVIAFLGTTLLWCVIELNEQEKRVEKGWFPKNPNRKSKSE